MSLILCTERLPHTLRLTRRERERERNFKGTRPLMGGATDHRLTTQVPSGEPFDLHT